MAVKIAPSLLSADFARLGEGVASVEAAGADWIHVDVMDGHYVPNLTIGSPVVAALRRVTGLPLDVHLMVTAPERLIDSFAGAGADYLTVHQEACTHLHRTLQQIRDLGVKPGVALNPATPLGHVEEVLPYVDLILIMGVNPGFGGQRHIETTADKVMRLRRMLAERRLTGVEVQVDGGVSAANAASLVKAGVSVLVAGAAIFNDSAPVAANIRQLRSVIGD